MVEIKWINITMLETTKKSELLYQLLEWEGEIQDLYALENMHLAWKALSELCRHYQVIYESIEHWLYNTQNSFIFMEPKEAQTAWLNNILKEAIHRELIEL